MERQLRLEVDKSSQHLSLPGTDELEARAWARIDSAVREFNPRKVYALFSGGHDSLVSSYVASLHPRVDGVVHINTGIGIPETNSFALDTSVGLFGPSRVRVMYAWDTSYVQMVLRYGFPGPGAHLYPYVWLKERAIARLVRESKQKWRDKIMLITGARAHESQRRMGFAEEVSVKGARVWVAPLFDFPTEAMRPFIRDRNLPQNPVSNNLHMSGECLCGAFAKPGELELIDLFYPRVAAHIRWLQREAAVVGVHAEWGVRPPKATVDKALKEYNEGNLGERVEEVDLQLCWSCEAKTEAG